MAESRVHFLDAFKFLAILGVLVAHLPPNSRFDATAWQAIVFCQQIIGWCVVGFFAVAGIVSSKGINTDSSTYLRRRAQRLLLPFVAFSVFYKVAVTLLAIAGLVKAYELPEPRFASVVQWLPKPADPQLYFLLYLFVIQLCCHLLARIDAVLLWVTFVFSSVVWVATLWHWNFNGNLYGPDWQLVSLYCAFFAAGVLAGNSPRRLAAFAFVFALLAVISGVCGATLPQALQIAVPFVLLALLSQVSASPLVRKLGLFGAESGGVYVWHAPIVIAAVSLACVALLGDGVFAACFTVAISYGAAVGIAKLVNQCKPLRWFHL